MANRRVRKAATVKVTAFSVTPNHIEKLDSMKGETGLSRSEIVRQLIESATPEKLEQPT